MADAADLLRQFQPYLRYDSAEGYFADSVEEWTANPANCLCTADGNVIAGAGTSTPLTLDLLGTHYPDGRKAEAGDAIQSTRTDYAAQYDALRRDHPKFRNVIYGRSKQEADHLWLQYWFFYFLNDYELAWGFDIHEGDWEMVQLRIDPERGRPDLATFAQHEFSENCDWPDEVSTLAQERGDAARPGDADRTLVYVGRGSHASFPEPGYQRTNFYDITDGKRHPATDVCLKIVPDPPPGWLQWPGHWGRLHARFPGPQGPMHHGQWADPQSLVDLGRKQQRRRLPDPGVPDVEVDRRGQALRIRFDFRRATTTPVRMTATVNSHEEHGVPPHRYGFGIASVASGDLQTNIPLLDDRHYDVAVALVGADDQPTHARVITFEPRPGLGSRLGHVVLAAAGRVVYLVRRWLGRD